MREPFTHGWVRSSLKRKKSGPGLGFKPSQPKLCLLRCAWQNTPLCLGHNFYAHSNLIFDQTNFFSITENSKNI